MQVIKKKLDLTSAKFGRGDWVLVLLLPVTNAPLPNGSNEEKGSFPDAIGVPESKVKINI